MVAEPLLILLTFLILIVIFIWMINGKPKFSQDVPALITSHSASALLLSCLDYRFLNRISNFMDSKGYRDNYDHFILAGASLGLDQEVVPNGSAWQRTWWDHLDIASRLHQIKRVIIVDHSDCGFYHELLGFDNTVEDLATPNIIPMKEIDIHSKYLRQAYRLIREKYPQLEVELYIIGLKENVRQITP